jgi:hypothetical protein
MTMSDLQTWTLLQRDGNVWFDDERADKTVHLRIVQDLSKTEIIWGVNLADCQTLSLFHLVSADKHYLVASYAMEPDTDPAILQNLVSKEFDGICAVSPYLSASRPFSRCERGMKQRHHRVSSRPSAAQPDSFSEMPPIAQMA